MDLSVLIPARNEAFLQQTIDDVLAHRRARTNIIVVLDGSWPTTPIPDHPDVHLIYHPESVGQRAATNEAARVSTAAHIMKLDAHCAVDEGFDAKLLAAQAALGRDVTQIPAQYNLHVFDWACTACQGRIYQGPTPTVCPSCKRKADPPGDGFVRDIVWRVRKNRRTEFWRFDNTLHFQYWSEYGRRPEASGDIVDVMSSLGACFFMRRDRFFELGGLDEAHGSWGQFGTEIACKSWLSGGRQVVNKTTWFAHMFRTQGGDFGFPYPLSGKQVDTARKHSRSLWIEGQWPQAVRPLSWLIEKFGPVPGWGADAPPAAPAASSGPPEPPPVVVTPPALTVPTKGVIFYTDNRGDERLLGAARRQLLRAKPPAWPLVCCSLQPVENFGQNIVLPLERGRLTMFKQILAALEAITTDVVFFCEHDVIYHPSHFDFEPPTRDAYYYNENVWKVEYRSGQALFYWTKQTSGLVAYRDLLLAHYRKRVAHVEAHGYDHRLGYEPGNHPMPRGLDNFPSVRYMSAVPNVDIRHNHNLTMSRWSQEQFHDKRTCEGWTMSDEVPGWGTTKGRFTAWLDGVDPEVLTPGEVSS
jgi:glycosyltransferase involved in cell wall biosynthesis